MVKLVRKALNQLTIKAGGNLNKEVPRRIKVYTFGGRWVGPPGVGEGDRFGTIPVDSWTIQMLLATQPWIEIIRPPNNDEKVCKDIHYRFLPENMKFRSIIHNTQHGPIIGVNCEALGSYSATHLTAMTHCAQIQYEEVPSGSVREGSGLAWQFGILENPEVIAKRLKNSGTYLIRLSTSD